VTRVRPLPLATALAITTLAVCGRATAHEVGLSRGDYVARGNRVEAVIAFARREAISVLPTMDGDRNESLSDAEVSASSEAYAKRIFEGIVVEREGVACSPKPTAARLVSEDGIDAYGAYECGAPAEGATITVKMTMLETLGSGHRHLVKLSNAGKLDEAMLHRREPSLTAKGGGAPAPSQAPEGAPPVTLGAARIAHDAALRVATGRDHVAFLVGLALMAGVPRKQMLIAAAAFFAAVSVTLLLAARGVVTPSPAIIAPLLAAGVVYVGVENLVTKDRIARWRIALPFGLVHGFALAAFFAQISPPAARTFGSILAFDAGVAIGVAAVAGATSALATALSKKAWYERLGVKIASAFLVALGVYGLISAVRGGGP
jgi:hypothetical protein